MIGNYSLKSLLRKFSLESLRNLKERMLRILSLVVGFRPVKIITMQQFVVEGGSIPRGYGIGWHLPVYAGYICFPFPLNHVFARIRKWYLKVRHVDLDVELIVHYAELDREHSEKVKYWSDKQDWLSAKGYNTGFYMGVFVTNLGYGPTGWRGNYISCSHIHRHPKDIVGGSIPDDYKVMREKNF